MSSPLQGGGDVVPFREAESSSCAPHDGVEGLRILPGATDGLLTSSSSLSRGPSSSGSSSHAGPERAFGRSHPSPRARHTAGCLSSRTRVRPLLVVAPTLLGDLGAPGHLPGRRTGFPAPGSHRHGDVRVVGFVMHGFHAPTAHAHAPARSFGWFASRPRGSDMPAGPTPAKSAPADDAGVPGGVTGNSPGRSAGPGGPAPVARARAGPGRRDRRGRLSVAASQRPARPSSGTRSSR